LQWLQASDTNSQKFGGALLDAVIFVAIITVMTAGLFLLMKYRVRNAHMEYPPACS
jgi:hypothetical protein